VYIGSSTGAFDDVADLGARSSCAGSLSSAGNAGVGVGLTGVVCSMVVAESVAKMCCKLVLESGPSERRDRDAGVVSGSMSSSVAFTNGEGGEVSNE
jgi:hypothetical protein